MPIGIRQSKIDNRLNLRHPNQRKSGNEFSSVPLNLNQFIPDRIKKDSKQVKKLASMALKIIYKSKRPVIYAGNGIRLSGAADEFLELVDLLKIPVLTSYVGYDLISSSHPYFFGRAHSLGQRAANFIIQNSDVLLSIGARLDVLTTGFTYKAFARAAFKIMVDIDPYELKKPTLSIDLPICEDAGIVIREMIRQLKINKRKLQIDEWLKYGRELNKKYPNIQPEFWKERQKVNPYCFIDTIGKKLRKDEVIVLSNGIGPMNCMYQSFMVKQGQRVILNLGCAEMGYGLPAAIGACIALKKKRVICFEGDGSLQLNIHELQVMKHHNLPIKLFIYSNEGYLSIRNTQNALFKGKYVGSDPGSGVSCPDYVRVGRAYGIPSMRINNHSEMEEKIKQVLEHPGPIICDIHAVSELMLTPKLRTQITSTGQFISPTLENMAPFLSENEIRKNMIIPMWKE